MRLMLLEKSQQGQLYQKIHLLSDNFDADKMDLRCIDFKFPQQYLMVCCHDGDNIRVWQIWTSKDSQLYAYFWSYEKFSDDDAIRTWVLNAITRFTTGALDHSAIGWSYPSYELVKWIRLLNNSFLGQVSSTSKTHEWGSYTYDFNPIDFWIQGAPEDKLLAYIRTVLEQLEKKVLNRMQTR